MCYCTLPGSYFDDVPSQNRYRVPYLCTYLFCYNRRTVLVRTYFSFVLFFVVVHCATTVTMHGRCSSLICYNLCTEDLLCLSDRFLHNWKFSRWTKIVKEMQRLPDLIGIPLLAQIHQVGYNLFTAKQIPYLSVISPLPIFCLFLPVFSLFTLLDRQIVVHDF